MMIAKKSYSLSKLIFVMVFSITLISCNTGRIVDNHSSEAIQVQSVFPFNGDTNVGISSPVVVEFKSSVESSEVEASLIDLNSNTPYNLKLTIDSNKTVYVYTPLSELNPNSTYRFILSQNNGQNSVNNFLSDNNHPESYSNQLVSSTYTTQSAYKIFVTSNNYKGNLKSSYSSASSGADAICNADNGNPDNSQYYKAMLSVVSERYACIGENLCGGIHNLDWVLQPRTSYYNVNSSLIGITSSQSIFNFPLDIAFGLGSSNNVWTGLSTTWGSVDGGDSCKAWTSSSSDNKGRCGRSAQTDPGAISNDKQDCNGERKLYCVMQPNVVLVSPLAGSITNNLTAPITVMFNIVSGVDSSTVTTNSFKVFESGVGVSGNAIAGAITSSDNITYTFTPNSPLLPGKIYIVYLSSLIHSNNGVPITATTQSFLTSSETKLIYLTSNKWWGDLLKSAQNAGSTATTGVGGADFLCQQDSQCPVGKTCKAIISDDKNRIACINGSESSIKLCGSGYSVDWTLSPNTTYVNTNGAIIGTTNNTGIFNFLLGYQFNSAISGGGKAWTGLFPSWTSDKEITCERWTIGDDGVNQLVGMIGYADQLNYKSIFAGANNSGGCSQYNKKDSVGGKYCYNQVDGTQFIDGCSKRGLYCAVQ